MKHQPTSQDPLNINTSTLSAVDSATADVRVGGVGEGCSDTEVSRHRLRPGAARLKVLVLHGFRQNARVMRSRTRKLRQALEPIAELIFANGPVPCNLPDAAYEAPSLGFDVGVGAEEPGRSWWNADGARYRGAEASLAYIAHMDAAHGPFDGVIGFSQGAAFAASLTSRLEQLRFVVCISGFVARDARLGELGGDVPSLHVVGQNDVLVAPERTRALARRFEAPVVIAHSGGHFVPGRWPIEAMAAFVEGFRETSIADEVIIAAKGLEERLALLDQVEAPGLLLDVWLDARGRALLDGLRAGVPISGAARACDEDTLRLIAYGLHAEGLPVAPLVLGLRREGALRLMTQFAADAGYGPLRTLAAALVEVGAGASLLGDVASVFAGRLAVDLDRLEVDWPSDAAIHAPRLNTASDRRHRLGRMTALFLAGVAPDGGGLDRGGRMRVYRRYRLALRTLKAKLASAELTFADRQRDQRLKRYYDAARGRLKGSVPPVSAAVLEPEPEQVLPAPLEELQPLFGWLTRDGRTDDEAVFPRGTVTRDGRLDLCKQVVGPEGISPLLDAMAHNAQVTRLLLGNNIVGDGGAKSIAEYIKNGGSRLDVWYIAGNHLTAAGLGHIVEALAEDTRVRQLWLKRNPLGASGGAALRELLVANSTLEVLDLVNCGLLDAGALEVIEGLSQNVGLRHLYLCANGLTAETARAMGRYLAEHDRLETLFISCNRLGAEGVRVLAEGVAQNQSLVRLSLASNHMGPAGAQAICEAVADHPRLTRLDLGYMRGTAVLGESANYIGDEGAGHVAELLGRNATLRSLDLLHNDISQRGVGRLVEAMGRNATLLELQASQFGSPSKSEALDALGRRLAANRSVTANAAALLREATQPAYLEEILSVYRTA